MTTKAMQTSQTSSFESDRDTRPLWGEGRRDSIDADHIPWLLDLELLRRDLVRQKLSFAMKQGFWSTAN
jgi:hypothetical protein